MGTAKHFFLQSFNDASDIAFRVFCVINVEMVANADFMIVLSTIKSFFVKFSLPCFCAILTMEFDGKDSTSMCFSSFIGILNELL